MMTQKKQQNLSGFYNVHIINTTSFILICEGVKKTFGASGTTEISNKSDSSNVLCGKVLPFAAKHWLLKSDSSHPTKTPKTWNVTKLCEDLMTLMGHGFSYAPRLWSALGWGRAEPWGFQSRWWRAGPSSCIYATGDCTAFPRLAPGLYLHKTGQFDKKRQ